MEKRLLAEIAEIEKNRVLCGPGAARDAAKIRQIKRDLYTITKDKKYKE